MAEQRDFQIMIRSNINKDTLPVINEFIDFISEKFVKESRFKMHFVSIKT